MTGLARQVSHRQVILGCCVCVWANEDVLLNEHPNSPTSDENVFVFLSGPEERVDEGISRRKLEKEKEENMRDIFYVQHTATCLRSKLLINTGRRRRI